MISSNLASTADFWSSSMTAKQAMTPASRAPSLSPWLRRIFRDTELGSCPVSFASFPPVRPTSLSLGSTMPQMIARKIIYVMYIFCLHYKSTWRRIITIKTMEDKMLSDNFSVDLEAPDIAEMFGAYHRRADWDALRDFCDQQTSGALTTWQLDALTYAVQDRIPGIWNKGRD